MKHFIVHYQEIVLKGKNRYIFVNRLIENIKYATAGLGVKQIRHKDGRLILDLSAGAGVEMISDRLSKTFGIANFVLTRRISNDVNVFKEEILHHIKDRDFKSFRVSARRGYKGYPLTSMDVDRIVGAHVKESTGAKVNLTKPELTIYVQILSGETYFYLDKIQGPGGLPAGTGGLVVCLLSGGIDSPVAAYRRMMLRIAERIAGETGALALITGDSLGQVASQTLENITTTEHAVTLPVLRPLVGMDKGEIIAQAIRIGP